LGELKEFEKQQEIEKKKAEETQRKIGELIDNPEFGVGNMEEMLSEDFDFAEYVSGKRKDE